MPNVPTARESSVLIGGVYRDGYYPLRLAVSCASAKVEAYANVASMEFMNGGACMALRRLVYWGRNGGLSREQRRAAITAGFASALRKSDRDQRCFT